MSTKLISAPCIALSTAGVTYSWSTGQTGQSVPITGVTNTAVTVVGTDQNGCQGTGLVQLKVSTCFGLEEAGAALSGISVYPNPNNGNFTLKSEKEVSISIVNELGQTVQTINLGASNGNQIEVRGLASGIYFITAQGTEGKVYEKIVIQ